MHMQTPRRSARPLPRTCDPFLPLSFQETSKGRKPVERRESSRLQSAAKLLRSLSKSKEVAGGGTAAAAAAGSPAGAGQGQCAPPPELPARKGAEAERPDRSHPAYHSEGKGARRRRSSGKENKEVKKDRSHSFHGKVDKKVNRYAASGSSDGGGPVRTPKRLSSSEARLEEVTRRPASFCQPSRTEQTVAGARSILLTEDNLSPVGKKANSSRSPDLIQDLPPAHGGGEHGRLQQHPGDGGCQPGKRAKVHGGGGGVGKSARTASTPGHKSAEPDTPPSSPRGSVSSAASSRSGGAPTKEPAPRIDPALKSPGGESGGGCSSPRKGLPGLDLISTQGDRVHGSHLR